MAVNYVFEWMLEKRTWLNLGHYFGIYLEGMRETTKASGWLGSRPKLEFRKSRNKSSVTA